ncbi:hypothetical protein LJC05_00930 [Bacteroides sp. OttesenSCG-928-J23]|nr:hypothetical protein [Bacteroides sp. OttesenSCG-928-N06]MDL2247279.1 hypothetical protein [Bacteroides sp. OttesenSCG-928-J23]MDL2299385.1 hypothetical protein [Bacteroides sp. OttesenSCG-928-E20]MDL2305054.1 hypothetical protein [Bacteroides sp. OttesenSCG-928-D19]
MKPKINYLIITLLAASVGMISCTQKQSISCKAEENDSVTTQAPTREHTKPVANEKLNDAARFVAGIPVKDENSKLYALTQTKDWKDHARNMDQIWNSFQQNAPKVLAFTKNELNGINQQVRTLFYPFGGPDFLFANAFFPDVDTYFLIGLERTGTAIEVKHPSRKTYKLYQDAVSDVLSLSFFRTRDMSVEMVNDTIDGVVPIISMLMARTDKEMVSFRHVQINTNGDVIATGDDSKHPNQSTGMVEITFFRKGTNRLQTLYYYATDLSNEGLEQNKPLVNFIRKFNRNTTATFIKSASYLMHAPGFSMIRDLVLDKSSAVMQDDSGIPITFYPKNKWNINLYGTFYKPVADYAQYPQPELRDAYQLGDPKPLNFRIGFARQSNLQVMRRK